MTSVAKSKSKTAKTIKDIPDNKVIASMKGVSKIYGEGETEVRALDDVTVEFEKGKFTAIMGSSGSGKSTLLQCLAGLDSVDGGSIQVGGEEITTMKDRKLTLARRNKIGFIFQSFNLVSTLTAKENIVLPLSIAGKKPDKQWLQQITETLGIDERLGHTPKELSGGQQQRVAAARALITKPDIIFADEPSGNLDSKSGDALISFLAQATHEFGQTILMVTHDAKAASQADRVIFLSDGQLVDEVLKPSVDAVIDKLKKIEA